MTLSNFKSDTLANELPEAVFLEDLSGNILDVNDQACDLLGYEREELLELTVDDLVPEGAPAFLPGKVDEATRAGEPLETVNLRKNGTEIPIELRGRMVEIEGIKRMLVSVRDISGRKKSEKQLKQYKMAVEGSDDLIAACDRNYNYLFANQAYAELYQQTKDDIENKNVAEVVGKNVFKDKVKPRIDRCLQGERIEYEMTRSHPRQGTRKLNVVYYPLKDEEGTHGIVGILRDVTEVKEVKKELEEVNERLRQSRERYKRYFDELGDAVFITKVGGEDHGRILDANSAAEEQTGYSLEELIGMNIENDIAVGEPETITHKEGDERLARGETINFVEKKRSKDGTDYWTEVMVTSIEYEGKKASLSINRDITEQKKVKKELERSETKFRAIAEQVHDGIYIYKGGSFEWVNRRASEILGYSREELTQKSVWDLIHPQDRDKVKKMTKKMMDGKEVPSTYEARVLTKDGEVRHAEFAASLIEYKGEQAILGAARDITERKEAEEELEESEEKYRTIFESAKEAIFIMKGSKFVDCNEKTLEMFECEREDIIGKHPTEFSPEKQPDGRASAEKAKEKMNLALEGNHQSFEWVHTTKDGEPFHAEITLNRYMIEDEKFVMAIVRDITEKKKAKEELKENEKKYRQIFNNANDIVTLHEQTEDGRSGQFIEVNDVACEILGYSREELLSMRPTDIVTSEGVQDLSDIMESLTGEDKQKFEMWVEAKDGRKVLVEVSYHVFELNGKERVLSIARNITERKRTQQALNEERDKLRHLHDAVDELQKQENEGSILRTAVEVAENILDLELCAIDLIEGDYLVTKAISSGLSPDQTHKYEIGEGIGGITVERGETIWGDDLRDHPKAKPASNEFRAFISSPIGEVGVFQVVSLEVGSFDKEDVELAEILADHLKEEIKRVRLEEDLREQAIRDPLTDLYNRRYFNETLGEEVERCKRYDKSIAFLMADVDRFKEINDRYTHQTGDEVLKEVAELLQEDVRNADTVVRYGGDEFLIMMTQTEEGVENTVKRLKDSLDRWNQESDLLDFPLTLAMGASYWSPDQDREVEEALKEADRKMYENKTR